MPKVLIIIILVMLYNKANTQTHGGFEQYYYPGNKGTSTIVPRVYYQTKKKWYAEVRYNYDEAQTFAFNAGKTFSRNGKISYSVTPVAGVVTGKLNGASLGVNGEIEYKKLFFSSESQYTFSSVGRNGDFLFNWSELGYQATNKIFAGLALQLTGVYKTTSVWEPGIMVGFSLDKFTFPLYTFSPLTNKRYFVLGINWEWQHLKADNKKIETPVLAKGGGSGI